MLRLVPPLDPTPERQLLQRLRAEKPPGVFQCPQCASRTSARIVNGAYRKGGRVKGGTVIHERICADCYQRGRVVDMEPVKPA